MPLKSAGSDNPFPELANGESAVPAQCQSGMCRGKCICSNKLLPKVDDVTDPDRALVTFKRKEPPVARNDASSSTSSKASETASSNSSIEDSSL